MRSSDACPPSLDGRTFVRAGNTTRRSSIITRTPGWSRPSTPAAPVALGRIGGTRDVDSLDVRDVHVSRGGSIGTGHCHAQLELLPDGRPRARAAEVATGGGRSMGEDQAA